MTNQEARAALVTAAQVLDPIKGKTHNAEVERLDIVSKFDESTVALLGLPDNDEADPNVVLVIEEIQTRSEALDARFTPE